MCALKATPVVRTQLQNTPSAYVTYEDFTASLIAIRNGAAPGPSAAIASMTKSLSKVMCLVVYEHMNNTWKERLTVSGWKTKLFSSFQKLQAAPT